MLEDKVAKRLGVSFSDGNETDLVKYFLGKFKKEFGYNYPLDKKGKGLAFNFYKKYGQDSFLIIKVLFDNYGGKWNNQVQGTSLFANNASWIVDQLYHEAQELKKIGEQSSEKQATNSDAFLSMFND